MMIKIGNTFITSWTMFTSWRSKWKENL